MTYLTHTTVLLLYTNECARDLWPSTKKGDNISHDHIVTIVESSIKWIFCNQIIFFYFRQLYEESYASKWKHIFYGLQKSSHRDWQYLRSKKMCWTNKRKHIGIDKCVLKDNFVFFRNGGSIIKFNPFQKNKRCLDSAIFKGGFWGTYERLKNLNLHLSGGFRIQKTVKLDEKCELSELGPIL